MPGHRECPLRATEQWLWCEGRLLKLLLALETIGAVAWRNRGDGLSSRSYQATVAWAPPKGRTDGRTISVPFDNSRGYGIEACTGGFERTLSCPLEFTALAS